MPRTRPADSVQSTALRWFSSLEQRQAGYELRDVRGWAHHTDVSRALNRVLQDELASLATRGFLDREDVALPGRTLGFWLYRISRKGAESLGAPAPSPPGSLLDPDKRQMIFTESQWAALVHMRAAKEQPSPVRFATRELGWRTTKEIRKAASSHRHAIYVSADDVHLLERYRLLDKRQEPGVARERPLTFYRINPLGEVVERLKWH